MSFNLYTMLDEAASSVPEQVCVVGPDATLTYRELNAQARHLASQLVARGLKRGAKVGVQLPNVPEFVVSYFGLLRAGMVMVPLNPMLRSLEILHQMRDSDAELLITGAGNLDEALLAAEHLPDLALVRVGDASLPAPARVTAFAELTQDTAVSDPAATSPDDTAVLLYTSGTTGSPKGAELTHFQLFMNCTLAGELIGARDSDVSIAALPLFHVFGLSSVLNVAVRYGSTMVLLPRFTAGLALEAIRQHHATIFAGVPTMYTAMVGAAAADRELGSLRIAVSGGASLPAEIIRSFEQRFTGVTILEGYGLSETASTTTFNISAHERKVGSVGKAIWGVDVRIADVDGQALPAGPGKIGEIVVRGHNVMKGYYGNREATAHTIRDGWLHTGDLGYLDQDGYLFIVDRIKDLVIRGGYNVYPREVEEVLYAHPDVVEAAVMGQQHDNLGQEVVAAVSIAPGAATTETDLIEFCRERLAAYKYPRSVRILPELPKGPTGKIVKKLLSDW